MYVSCVTIILLLRIYPVTHSTKTQRYVYQIIRTACRRKVNKHRQRNRQTKEIPGQNQDMYQLFSDLANSVKFTK
jgi:hypothetical protein